MRLRPAIAELGTMERVLITGGSGLVGHQLTTQLINRGYTVRYLNRTKRAGSAAETFTWNVNAGTIEAGAFDGVDHIVHLAGAGIIDKRWTTDRKKVLIDSRVATARLLFDGWQASGAELKSFTTASGIGYYGSNTSEKIYDETDPADPAYIAQICVEWERAAELFQQANIRTCIMRIGVVLAKEGGALTTMAKPVRFGAGAPIGSGKQWVPWIHMTDLCHQFVLAIESEWEGIYNGVAPNPVTNKELTKLMANALNRPLILPNVPGFLLKIMLGEMASLVLEGSRVSSAKAQQAGMTYLFPTADSALQDLLAAG